MGDESSSSVGLHEQADFFVLSLCIHCQRMMKSSSSTTNATLAVGSFANNKCSCSDARIRRVFFTSTYFQRGLQFWSIDRTNNVNAPDVLTNHSRSGTSCKR
ncbi:hypothetical protein T12_1117 [Trichinella patagoniensis]|uniref:Uncharacterized protein n=1 Tax=Trichinella patagoniensis TaxID=990121 RepID=A0A0V1A6K8_9BILA|nr:hypothetical protein T12_1117 [Trichinella patagoniensis]